MKPTAFRQDDELTTALRDEHSKRVVPGDQSANEKLRPDSHMNYARKINFHPKEVWGTESMS